MAEVYRCVCRESFDVGFGMTRALRIDLRSMSPAAGEAFKAALARQGVTAQPTGKAKSRRASVDFNALLEFNLSVCGLGIPKAQREYLFAPNRKFPADFAWPEFKLLVEVQGGIWRRGGGAHSHPSNILRDIEKVQLAVLNGWFVFPVTTDEVKNGQAVQLIELALRSKGWNP